MIMDELSRQDAGGRPCPQSSYVHCDFLIGLSAAADLYIMLTEYGV